MANSGECAIGLSTRVIRVGFWGCSCSSSSLAKTPQHYFMNDCPSREQVEMARKYFSLPVIRSLWTILKSIKPVVPSLIANSEATL